MHIVLLRGEVQALTFWKNIKKVINVDLWMKALFITFKYPQLCVCVQSQIWQSKITTIGGEGVEPFLHRWSHGSF